MPESSTLPAAAISLKDWHAVASLIDHTLLKPEATRDQVVQICRDALHYGFATVFVHPWHVESAAQRLRGTAVKTGTPIGFPQGATLSTVKRFEAAEALRRGAGELDMVMNVGALKSGAPELVEADIRSVVEVAHAAGVILKVILETALLTREEKIIACELSVAAGADFVKTSTGLIGGATVEDVALMRSVVGKRARVKASGGIRTLADLTAMLGAGADRIGTSASVTIIRELGAPDPRP
jgi:deoxyribose-phosphate aldolase